MANFSITNLSHDSDSLLQVNTFKISNNYFWGRVESENLNYFRLKLVAMLIVSKDAEPSADKTYEIKATDFRCFSISEKKVLKIFRENHHYFFEVTYRSFESPESRTIFNREGDLNLGYSKKEKLFRFCITEFFLEFFIEFPKGYTLVSMDSLQNIKHVDLFYFLFLLLSMKSLYDEKHRNNPKEYFSDLEMNQQYCCFVFHEEYVNFFLPRSNKIQKIREFIRQNLISRCKDISTDNFCYTMFLKKEKLQIKKLSLFLNKPLRPYILKSHQQNPTYTFICLPVLKQIKKNFTTLIKMGEKNFLNKASAFLEKSMSEIVNNDFNAHVQAFNKLLVFSKRHLKKQQEKILAFINLDVRTAYLPYLEVSFAALVTNKKKNELTIVGLWLDCKKQNHPDIIHIKGIDYFCLYYVNKFKGLRVASYKSLCYSHAFKVVGQYFKKIYLEILAKERPKHLDQYLDFNLMPNSFRAQSTKTNAIIISEYDRKKDHRKERYSTSSKSLKLKKPELKNVDLKQHPVQETHMINTLRSLITKIKNRKLKMKM